ncbi:MAG: class I SAM-dependent methyltransferase [Patescibacteria group bacterium]
MKLREIEWRSVYSGTPVCELERLETYCERASSADHRLAIEIGSHEGGSAALMAQYFDVVLCVDPWGKEEPLSPQERIASFVGNPASNVHFPAFIKNMVRLDLWDKVVFPVVGTARTLLALPKLYASMVFADDGHVYQCCEQDIRAALHHIASDGLLVCHDYHRPEYYEPDNPRYVNHVDPYVGVRVATDEAIDKHNLVILDHFEGIVALMRK